LKPKPSTDAVPQRGRPRGLSSMRVALVVACAVAAVPQRSTAADAAPTAAAAPPSAAAENGTDPTVFLTVAEAKHEYLDLNQGIASHTLRLTWTQPIGAAKTWALIARVPVASVDAGGNDSFDLGDASLKLSHVFGLTKTHAWVAQGELVLDTAARPELGTGKQVFKGTLIYARRSSTPRPSISITCRRWRTRATSSPTTPR
jgi:hypothetical protein